MSYLFLMVCIFMFLSVNSRMVPHYLGNTLIFVDSQKLGFELSEPNNRFRPNSNAETVEISENDFGSLDSQLMSMKVMSGPSDKILTKPDESQSIVIINQNLDEDDNDLVFNGVVQFINKTILTTAQTTITTSEKSTTQRETTTTTIKPTTIKSVNPTTDNSLLKNFRSTLRQYFNLDQTKTDGEQVNIRQKLSNILQFLQNEENLESNNVESQQRSNSKWQHNNHFQYNDVIEIREPTNENTVNQNQPSEDSNSLDYFSSENLLYSEMPSAESDFSDYDKADYDYLHYDYYDSGIMTRHRQPIVTPVTSKEIEVDLQSLTNVSSLFDKKSCRCGLSLRQPMFNEILQEEIGSANKYPWMIQILDKQEKFAFCSGTIINDLYIITAAHCLHGLNPDQVFVQMGHTRALKRTKVWGVKSFIIHRRYRMDDLASPDIALIRMKKPILYSENVLPVCLSQQTSLAGKEGLIVGWGSKREGGQFSTDIQQTSVKIMETTACLNFSTYHKTQLPNRVLCAKGDLSATCQGDSGGPLLYKDGLNYYQAGITSSGFGCQRKEYPGIYTHISSYSNWIRKNTKNALYCQPNGHNLIRKIEFK